MEKLKKQLVEGEEILHVAYVHPAIFLHPALIMIVALMVGILFHWLVGSVIAMIGLYPLITATIRYFTTRLVLTNRRVLARYGFFNKDNIQIKLSRVESAHLEEPLLGQILGYSTVMIKGIGAGAIPITFIAAGEDYVKELEKITLGNDTP